MRLSLKHQGVSAAKIDAALDAETERYQALLEALAGVRVVLDSACAIVVNR